MNEMKLWILTGFNTLLLGIVGYFILKFMKQSEETPRMILELERSVNSKLTDIRVSLEQIKCWTTERFVTDLEFKEKSSELHSMILELHSRFDSIRCNFPKNGGR